MKYVKAAELATNSVMASSSMGSCTVASAMGRAAGNATGRGTGFVEEGLCWYLPTLKNSPCADRQTDRCKAQPSSPNSPLPEPAQGHPGWCYLEGDVPMLRCDGRPPQQGVVDGGEGVQLGGHCRDTGAVGGSQTAHPLLQPSVPQTPLGTSPTQSVTWATLPRPLQPQPWSLGSPHPPFICFRASSSLLMLLRSSRQSWKQIRVSASPRMGVPHPAHLGGHQFPIAQGPSTHLLVQFLTQGCLEQRCQQVVEPAVGQNGVLRSPQGAPASPSPTPQLGAPGSPHGGGWGSQHHLCPR